MSVLQDIRRKGLLAWLGALFDEAITRFTAGLSWNDLRGMLRGDPPGRPNPRLQLHSEAFWLHIKPSFYHESVTRLGYTFRLGWLATFLFVFETITGILLMIFYAPTPATAYGDILNLLSNVPLGSLMRDLHRAGAEAMVVVVVLHMARTFITGSYKKPRQFTWFTGVILLLMTLLLSFSGYLLPWDQLAYWAVTIGTSMAEAVPPPAVGNMINLVLRGAPDIGEAGLLRFYLLHVLFVPSLLLIFFFVHYYKVVHFSISLPASQEEIGQDTAKRIPADRRVYFLPDVMVDEIMLTALAVLALIVYATWLYTAPLEHHADPGITPFHTTAPWYFLWIQGMLKLGDKTLYGVIIPGIVFGVLFVLPYIDFNPSRRASDRKVILTVGVIFSIAMVVLSYMGTPKYGVSGTPAQEVIQEFIPMEGTGPVRALGYEGVPEGTFDSSKPDTFPKSGTEFARIFEEMHQAVTGPYAEGLPNGHVIMVVEPWQNNLKKVTMRVEWDAATAGQTDTLDKTIYLHADSQHGE